MCRSRRRRCSVGRCSADKGWDPYCELPGTLWLLHWLLVAPVDRTGVVAGLHRVLRSRVHGRGTPAVRARSHQGLGRPNRLVGEEGRVVLAADVLVGHSARATFDDLIDCPFRELGLLQPSAASADCVPASGSGPNRPFRPAWLRTPASTSSAGSETSSRTATISSSPTSTAPQERPSSCLRMP